MNKQQSESAQSILQSIAGPRGKFNSDKALRNIGGRNPFFTTLAGSYESW